MQVTVTTTQQVQISEKEQRRIAIAVLRNAAKWVDGNYIENGNLMLREHYATSHSFYEDLVVRNATQLDLATDMLITNLLSNQ
jgi:hypothetical protein